MWYAGAADRRNRMQRSFKRELGSLAPLFEFTNEAAVRYRLDDEVVYAMNLAVEEIFTNMVKYGGGGPEVSVGLEVRGDRLVIDLAHPGARPFDVAVEGQFDPASPLAARVPGGIGLYLVRRIMDEVVYEHRNGVAHVTLTKRLGGS